MCNERFFITGAMGCLGAWVVRNLVQDHVPVTVFDLSENKQRLELIMSAAELAKVQFIRGDITNTEAVCQAVQANETTHLIHLAALQVPFCKADPPLGAAVNVLGTVNIFEAAKRAWLRQVVYAISVAVYGSKEKYRQRLLPRDAPLHPMNHYGVYKQANEGTARIYWQDEEIGSVGLRPYTIYGPGRDQGLTSAPTKAMQAAARGEGYHIPFGGVSGYQLADDVAKIFIQATRTPIEGAEVFNIKGEVAHMREVIGAIEEVVTAVKGRITFDDIPLPFPEGQDDTELKAFLGEIPNTPLKAGVAQTIAYFKQRLKE